MQLLTPEQRETMLANGRRYRSDPDVEPNPVVKLFTPWAACTWLLTDLDPDDDDIASGLCDLGFGEPEIGSVRTSEIADLRGPGGLRAERDVNFVAKETIGTYAARPRIDGRINACPHLSSQTFRQNGPDCTQRTGLFSYGACS